MAPKDFHHPFQPYPIQQQFMEAVYDCIEDRRVGIFESPTGTGKSLSLLCASLTWLREHKRKQFDAAQAAIETEDGEPDWIAEHARESRRREMKQVRAEYEERLQAIREKEQQLRERNGGDIAMNKKRKTTSATEQASSEDDFILEDYDEKATSNAEQASNFSSLTAKLMEKLGMLGSETRDDVVEDVNELKIFFSSRTHSQLSQLVGELQRVKLPPAIEFDDGESTAHASAAAQLPSTSHRPSESVRNTKNAKAESSEAVKQLSLGSRRNLCINHKVTRLGDQTAINERCIELQQPNIPGDQRCPYLPSKDSEGLALDFRDHALARVRDIEDLAVVGTKLGVCPYYASRAAIGSAEMVTLPYPLLLSKSARDALGISLKDHIVIIDEAHNLMSAVEGAYSSQLTDSHLRRGREALMVYLQKFRNRLKGANRVYVAQLIRVLDSLLQCIANLDGETSNGGTVDTGQLLAGKGVDQINMSKLVQYISDSKLARKVEGYMQHIASAKAGSTNGNRHAEAGADVPILTHVQNFLATLANPSTEGRFFWSRQDGERTLRYMLLDPSEHFRDIVEDARAVILAGGTMSPMEDYREQLFPYLPSLVTFSCGHLIPPDNLLVRTIATDAQGPLDMRYKSRDDKTALRIGNALLRILPHVRGGTVVFFPSYTFLQQIHSSWHHHPSFLTHLSALKPLFWDSRHTSPDNNNNDNNPFTLYAYTIRSQPTKGATLFSVLGGKLSEGINFSDDLGRCVVVVGLPFPNLETAEWKARMAYLDAKFAAGAGREHAENVCMRAVNQAIGRVIRHRADWASVLLLDARFATTRVRGKLPGWIQQGLPPTGRKEDLEEVVGDMRWFFQGKREND